MANKLARGISANIAAILAAGVMLDDDVTHRSRSSNQDSPTTLGSRCRQDFHPRHHAGFGLLRATTTCEEATTKSETEAQRFDDALNYHRSKISYYRRKWEYTADSSATTSTKTPSRSWPDNIPPVDDLSFLLEDIKYCDRSEKFNHDKSYCNTLRFRVASSLLLQDHDEGQKKGLEMLKTLVEKDHSDAMVLYGMCLNDGRVGIEPNPKEAVSLFRRCNGMHQHPQSQYELGVAYYMGEGVVENEQEAVRLFKLAADKNHPAACYMLGDCLLDGIGVNADRASALKWLVRAAELGHRGARSRVMAVLEKRDGEDYGCFTDASRQTILMEQAVIPSVDKGGDDRYPTELIRRKTIVSNSRKES